MHGGDRCAVIATAPGRVGILGNPTDGYGGCVISCTVPFRAEARFRPGQGLRAIVGDCAADFSSPHAWKLQGDPVDLVRSVVAYLGPANAPEGTLRVRTTIPRQAGLAGSTALVAVILGALDSARVGAERPEETAERLRVVERHYLGVACGFQDQYSILFGGLNALDFSGKAGQLGAPAEPYATVTPLAEPPDDELPFIIAHTGVARNSGAVHAPIRERWEAGEARVIAGYERIANLCREGRTAWERRDWRAFGGLMDENHAIQRDLGGSGSENERLIALAKARGAWGAKLAGAGKGGTIVALHPAPETLAAEFRSVGAAPVFRLRREQGLALATAPPQNE